MTEAEFALRILVGAVCGVIVGVERAHAHKIVGVRTLGLIGLSSALLVAAAQRAGVDPSATSRVLQGLVTGVGFLGAGVILHGRGDSQPHGLTTAAAVWGCCISGAVAGLGEIAAALAVTAAMVCILGFGGRVDRILGARPHTDSDTDLTP